MEFNLNGEKRTYQGDPNQNLMDYLRNTEKIISPKDGCSPEGVCGCCTVLLDNKAVKSCISAMKRVEGKQVVTTEGLHPEKRETVINAFMEKGGLQCGFCTPGILMKVWPLFDAPEKVGREDFVKALNSNLCRCTGFKKIVDSCMHAAEAFKRGMKLELPSYTGKLGDSLPKYDSKRLATGHAPYVADLEVDGMLHGALKFSDHPRARVISLDLSGALNHPGVERILTCEDIPGERHTGLIVQDWPLMIEPGEETRYIGDVLAVVVAVTEQNAREAAGKIRVDYEVLSPVTDPKEALESTSPKVHTTGNLLSNVEISRGDLNAAHEKSTFVTRGTYSTQRIEHAFMEMECCLARPWEQGVEVYSQSQGVYEDRKSISSLLGLPQEQVRVMLMPNGGGFGGKEDLSVQGHASLAAYLMKKPVRVALTREESICMHPKRHPLSMDIEMGCDSEGRFTFVKSDIIGDTGAYASVGMKVLERAAGHATGAYHVDVVEVRSRAVYTNNIPCGAMRGFGVNQINFAVESCVDELCEMGGFDRWQIRYDNALTPGGMTSTGQVLQSGIGIRKTLEALKNVFQKSKYAGIACGIKNTGIGNGVPDTGKVKIVVESSERIVIHQGWTEMGQGVYTMAVQFFCEVTGLPPELVEVRVDTSEESESGMTTASRGTSIIGHSVIDAGRKLKTDLERHTLDELAGKVYEGEWACDWTTALETETANIQTHYSYSYATQVVTLDDSGKLDTVYAAHDAGRIINPILFEGQLEGSIHMGLGYALTEDMAMEDGIPVHRKLGKMGLIRSSATPEIVVIGVEEPDENGPYGAKGVGEIGLVPTASAVANAFKSFSGERQYSLPLKSLSS